jgi:hypothetical protein
LKGPRGEQSSVSQGSRGIKAEMEGSPFGKCSRSGCRDRTTGPRLELLKSAGLASLEVVERSLGLATEHSLPLVSGRVHTSGLPIARVARAGLCAAT